MTKRQPARTNTTGVLRRARVYASLYPDDLLLPSSRREVMAKHRYLGEIVTDVDVHGNITIALDSANWESQLRFGEELTVQL